MLRGVFLGTLLILALAACAGPEGWSVGPGIDLSGPHSGSLSFGGGGPSSATLRGGRGADALP